MAFDIEMIKEVYKNLPSKVDAARKLVGRPLTLTEKILYAHLHTEQKPSSFEKGKSPGVVLLENIDIQSLNLISPLKSLSFKSTKLLFYFL